MNDRPGYGDAEAKRIIERATEIDRGATIITAMIIAVVVVVYALLRQAGPLPP